MSGLFVQKRNYIICFQFISEWVKPESIPEIRLQLMSLGLIDIYNQINQLEKSTLIKYWSFWKQG